MNRENEQFMAKKLQKMNVLTRFLTILILVLTPFTVFSVGDGTESDLKLLENAIKSGEFKQQQLKKTAEQIKSERLTLSAQIKLAAKQIQQSEAHLSSGERKLDKLSQQENILKTHYETRKKILATLLSALLRLEKNPAPALLSNPDEATNALRSAIMLGKIVPEVKKQSDVIASDLGKLNTLQQELSTQQDALIVTTQALRKQRSYIASLLDQKLSLSNKTQAEIKLEQQKMAALGQKAKNIRELFARIEQQKKLDLAIAAKLAAEQEAIRLREIEAQRQLLELAKKQNDNSNITQIENNITQLKKPPARTSRPLVNFANLKRKLPYPAQGALLRKFGQKDATNRETKGITISTRAFAQITAPATGTVLFADYFSNYGYLIIIDVGSGYNILLTGLGEIAVSLGQFIETGDPIGIMPRNAINTDLSAVKKPILYVEFRRQDKPINSAPWWAVQLSQK